MTLRLQEAVAHVAQNLELSPVDAATYVRLCMGGPWKVSELASALEVHRNDVYRSLERLAARGLVETTLESPARYAATDPMKMLDLELERRHAAMEALDRRRQDTTALVRSLRDEATAPAESRYRIVQGRQEIAAARRKLIADAQEEVLGITTSPHGLAAAEFDGTLEAILARGEGGPRMRFLLNVPDAEVARVGLHDAAGVQVRRLGTEAAIHFLIADGKEILLTVVQDPARSVYAQGDVALLTPAPGLLEAERAFFEQCWGAAQPVAPPARPAGTGSA